MATRRAFPINLLVLMVIAAAGLWPAAFLQAQAQPAQATPSPKAKPSPLAAPQAQPSPEQTPNPYTMDGGAGPCSIELTVTDTQGKPVFAALINVHIAYGFGGFHKLDLGVYTSHEGKAKFTGLPAKVRNPPLEFTASKGNLRGVAAMDPATECQARHDILMDTPKQSR